MKALLSQKKVGLMAILLIWAIDLYSRFKYNGLVYGFDYGLFHPDGVFYTFRALHWAGYDSLNSAQLVSDWYSSHAFKGANFSSTSILPGHNVLWDLVNPRILYPLLSVPFVYFLGIPGMLAIPAISLLAIFLGVFWVLKSRPIVAVLIVTILSSSTSFMRWMLANTTDSLLAALMFLSLLLVQKLELNRNKYAISCLIILTSVTRFCLPIWLGIFTLFTLTKIHRKYSLFGIALSVVSALPALSSNSSSAFLPGEGNVSLINKILHFPFAVLKVLIFEIVELAILDKILFACLIYCTFKAFLSWKNLTSQLYLAVFTSVWIIGGINGTVGVNFRYQLPLIGMGIIFFAKDFLNEK